MRLSEATSRVSASDDCRFGTLKGPRSSAFVLGLENGGTKCGSSGIWKSDIECPKKAVGQLASASECGSAELEETVPGHITKLTQGKIHRISHLGKDLGEVAGIMIALLLPSPAHASSNEVVEE